MDHVRTAPRPDGCPHLGLSSPVVGCHDGRSSSVRLRERVEAHEHDAGTALFAALHLDTLRPARAFELAHIYLGLRRWYPGVAVDLVDFAADLPPRLGEAWMYGAHWPELHDLARSEAPETIAELKAIARRHGCAEAGADLPRGNAQPRDFTTAGSIRLSMCFDHPRCMRAIQHKWDRKSATAARRGTARYMVPMQTSLAGTTLVHEFGHLLESVMWSYSPELASDVYASLSVELLGLGATPTARSWTKHLVNLRSYSLPAGPAAGDADRTLAIKRLHRYTLANRLGRYSMVSREELFAETFATALAGRDPALRAVWVHEIRPMLAEAGIARR